MSWFSALTPPAQAAVVSAAVSAIVAVGVAIAGPLLQRPLERLRAQLADQSASKGARRSYEFDARKRLYAEIEPLLFQLFEATENSYFRVASLVRSHRQERLKSPETSWLNDPQDYYFTSTIYFLFQPLAMYRLIQRSTTFVDLGLDDRIRTRYWLLKLSVWTFTDPFILAQQHPPLPYEPGVADWKSAREANPQAHWRQGLNWGHIDRFIDALIVADGDTRRPITFGEFEQKAKSDESFRATLDPVVDIFLMFDFATRPILGRILLVHACLMRLLLLSYVRSMDLGGLRSALDAFLGSGQAKNDLFWWSASDPDHSVPVRAYLLEHLGWISSDHYAVETPQ
jgi:hypothetical protein